MGWRTALPTSPTSRCLDPCPHSGPGTQHSGACDPTREKYPVGVDKLREGTIVDATIIAAPSSTKNRAGERDPEMHQREENRQE